ncbi:hypothetical protein H6G20_06140 [Desertifilum sp. FACHB-1129]|uniref:hypothetical protein n=1 Tax=unclassified Desertifilum TaxID=2621682 RepID=UPI001686D7B9|nr:MULTISPECIES: hypothetical protein [unclassified Desertifilum]MBD2311237.1 hypothetical protein [Desertifilum sp. FACHB-1129]MBD2324318.1 hypothetical protein [Desertifilum sp. FACHB-866]MBD2334332.1 hypothetical protein [Desertifilum sp. FACHB-868]MDA0213178.1 hypothetical protein [Cyanobacteria bacterium FC1]
MKKLTVQPYLVASNPQQEAVLEYLMQRYGQNFKKTLVFIIWDLLTERYLVDALYTQKPLNSEIEYEGKRIIGILAGEQVKIKELLDINHRSSKDLVDSLENLLASSNAIKKPVPEPQVDLSTRRSIDKQQEEQPFFDLKQFAEDAYEYRVQQIEQSANSESVIDSENHN